MAVNTLLFEQAKSFWAARFNSTQDLSMQQLRVESVLRRCLKANIYYENGMDFGCGSGRFIPVLSQHCGHVWGVDILPQAIDAAEKRSEFATGVLAQWPFKMIWRKPRLDLLWVSFVFQHITGDAMLESICAELVRISKPGCRVLVIDNAVDKAWHVKSRTPERLARLLSLNCGFEASRIAVNDQQSDHWLIDGTRA